MATVPGPLRLAVNPLAASRLAGSTEAMSCPEIAKKCDAISRRTILAGVAGYVSAGALYAASESEDPKIARTIAVGAAIVSGASFLSSWMKAREVLADCDQRGIIRRS